MSDTVRDPFAFHQPRSSKPLSLGKPDTESCQVSTSDRSDWTAQKRLLESYGLASSGREAFTVNFLSRLSAQSVNDTDTAVLAGAPQPDFSFWDSQKWPASCSPSIVPDSTAITPEGQGNVSKSRDVVLTGAIEHSRPASKRHNLHECPDTSTTNTAESGLAVLAAATARFEAIESIVDTLRAVCSKPDMKARRLSSAVRRRDRIRNRRFEKSSFSLNSKSRSLKR